ncbi:MAG TPA: hypothetical protein VGN09_27230 [Vicinamibacteria bacterium]|jgi:hypothetical protein
MPLWASLFMLTVAVLVVYVGSRVWSHKRGERETREAALQAIGRLVGPAEAAAAVDLDHRQCFDKSYKTGFAVTTFYTDAYAKCVQSKVLANLALRRPAATPPPRPAPSPAAQPTSAPRAMSSIPGHFIIGDVKIREFTRGPQFTALVAFSATGDPETFKLPALCSFTVECQGKVQGAQNQRTVVGCPLEKVEESKMEGELYVTLPTAVPADAACSIDLKLADRSRFRSDAIVIPLGRPIANR